MKYEITEELAEKISYPSGWLRIWRQGFMDPSRSPEGANYEGFAHNGIYWIRESESKWKMKENFEIGMFDRQRTSQVEDSDCQVLEKAWKEGLDRWAVEAKMTACPRCGGGLQLKYSPRKTNSRFFESKIVV